ncbi:hypothetical protein GIX45_16710 [Erwinia sp. CPCC 100877]|nr:hypothetical protein [Erwinia sp. CPCC 100877]
MIENYFKLKQQLHQQIIFVYELTKNKDTQLLKKEAVLAHWQPLAKIEQIKPAVLKQLLRLNDTPLHIVNNDW